jgi:hypothetical protein
MQQAAYLPGLGRYFGRETVKLLIKRDQLMKGLLGNKATFKIMARAEISPEEQKAIVKYGLGETVLYKKFEVAGGSGLLGIASRAVLNATNVVVTINSLVSGSRVECKDVVDMLAVRGADNRRRKDV